MKPLLFVSVDVPDVSRGLQMLFLHLLPDSSGLVVKNSCVPRFWESEDHDEPEKTNNNHLHPEQPSPTQVLRQESRNHQSQWWTASTAETIDCHWKPTLVALPKIADGASAVCQGRASKEAGDKSNDDNRSNIRSQGEAYLKNDKHEPGDDVYRASAIEFAQWSKEHWSDGEPQDIHRKTKSCYLAGHSKS